MQPGALPQLLTFVGIIVAFLLGIYFLAKHTPQERPEPDLPPWLQFAFSCLFVGRKRILRPTTYKELRAFCIVPFVLVLAFNFLSLWAGEVSWGLPFTTLLAVDLGGLVAAVAFYQWKAPRWCVVLMLASAAAQVSLLLAARMQADA